MMLLADFFALASSQDRLYTAFDEISERHGLFKVETIGASAVFPRSNKKGSNTTCMYVYVGVLAVPCPPAQLFTPPSATAAGDAYMCVGNIREEGLSTDHCRRIALFALEAVAAAQAVSVLEDDPSMGFLSIRAGFHAGPVRVKSRRVSPAL